MKSIKLSLAVYALVASTQVYAQTCKSLFQEEAQTSVNKTITADSKWINMGKNILENEPFKAKLEWALYDFQKFHETTSIPIRVDPMTSIMIFGGLKMSQDPKLVGQFIETFLKTDRLTRQYLLSKIVVMEQSTFVGGVVNEVDVKLTKKSYHIDKTLEQTLSEFTLENLPRLEVEAYFGYTSYYKGYRPVINDKVAVQKISLRYLESKKYQVIFDSTSQAAKLLADVPVKDAKIDQTLLKLIEESSKLPEYILSGKEAKIAMVELSILERTAKKLSALETDLKFTRQVLNEPSISLSFTVALVEFHKKNNILKFPELHKIVVARYKDAPDQLKWLGEAYKEIVDPASVKLFMQDLDFKVRTP